MSRLCGSILITRRRALTWASALFMTGRFSEAIDQCKQALRIDPDSSEAHNNLGNALAQTGRASEAIDHYKQTLRMNPNSSDAHNNLGAALALMGRISEAIEQLKSALRINPNNSDARNNLTKVRSAAEKQSGRRNESFNGWKSRCHVEQKRDISSCRDEISSRDDQRFFASLRTTLM